MTLALDTSEIIDAAPDAVWAVLTDWPGMVRWVPSAEGMRGPTPPAVGVTLTFSARGAERTSTITELETGRLLTLTSTQGPVTAHYRYSVEPDGTKTRVGLRADVLVRGLLRVLAPTIRKSIAKEDGEQLARLRAIAESGG
jgi:carbon monoxide dehydrogenase subunit G